MIVEEIRTRLRADRFRPFLLRMKDGRVFVVPDVGWMAMGGRNGSIARADGGVSFIDPTEAAGVEPLDPGAAAIDPETLRVAVRARPFVAFRMRLADGRTFPILQPERIAISPDGRQAVLFTEESELVQFDRLLIVALESLGGEQGGLNVDTQMIRQALTAKPFRPFRRMNDGRTFDTYHPDWLFVGPLGTYVLHNDQLDNGRITTLEPLLIASMEAIPPLASPVAPASGQAG